jgi:hypothetical protein
MAGVMCPSCRVVNDSRDALCRECGYDLAEAGAPPRPRVPLEKVQAAPGPALDVCPACGADVPDPSNLVCVDCLEELSPRAQPTSASHTRREAAASGGLRLLFPERSVGVPPVGALLLGRDADQSPLAALFAARDNVSRRHASVGVGPDGTGWVRDEFSTNGTFVNGTRVPPGATVPLADGDEVRIASDVTARVEVGRTAAP